MTVAILEGGSGQGGQPHLLRRPEDFAVEWYSGSGAGGQHRNKHQNSARIRHLPTGLVRSAQTRSRENSHKEAMAALLVALDAMAVASAHGEENAVRRAAVGSGERSDKRRTYRFQEGRVHDHGTGRSADAERVMRGDFPLLW